MELKGSKTEKNLMEAFAGESQARNKYTYFASVAKKEGYEQIAALFLETAENEKEEAITLDNMSSGNSISLKGTLDSGEKYHTPAVLTLLTNDFCTYEGIIEPQAIAEMVLIFEIPEGTTAIDNLILKINKNDTIFEINL